MASKKQHIYQLKITLLNSKPPIWRRFLVSNDLNLGSLHAVIQVVMGWQDSHLHQFVADQVFYGPVYEDALDMGMEYEDESKYHLSQLLQAEKDKIMYEYDFGDGWMHKIELEKILPFNVQNTTPQCIKGKGACPPEDCGGVWGYADLLETLRNPQHPDRNDLLDWLGGEFNPNAFDIDDINVELAKLFR